VSNQIYGERVNYTVLTTRLLLLLLLLLLSNDKDNISCLQNSIFTKLTKNICTSNSCNTGMCALPDMYTRHPRASVYISGNALLPVLQLICYILKVVKLLKSIATNAIQTKSNMLVAKMVMSNISSLYKLKLI